MVEKNIPKKTIMLFVIILFMFSIIQVVYSTNSYKNPSIVFIQEFGGPQLDIGWSITTTNDEGYLIGGETTSFGAGGYDAILIKTDNNGNEIWNKTYGGSHKDGCRCLVQTKDNNIILAGYTDSYGNPGHDFWLIKTDEFGNEVWNKTYGVNASDAAFNVIETQDHGYLLCGYAYQESKLNKNIHLVKTDQNGIMQWQRFFGGNGEDYAMSAKQAPDKGYLIAGATDSYGMGRTDCWLIKTDEFGNEVWNKTYGGHNDDWIGCVHICNDGGILLVGDTKSYGNGEFDLLALKTDSQGNKLWQTTVGKTGSSETAYSIQETDQSEYIIVGSQSDTNSNIFVTKLNNSGIHRWNTSIGDSGHDIAYSITKNSQAQYILTGIITNNHNNQQIVQLKLQENTNQPTITILQPYSGETLKETYPIKGTSNSSNRPINTVEICFDNSTWIIVNGTTNWNYTWNTTTTTNGAHTIKARAFDGYNYSNIAEKTIIVANNFAPQPPHITGPTTIKYRRKYCFEFLSTDPDGDEIMYIIDWGDGTQNSSYLPTNQSLLINHTWTLFNQNLKRKTLPITTETIHLRAKAMDTHGAESQWQTHNIELIKLKGRFFSILQDFFLRVN